MYTLIGSAKLNWLDPELYLRTVLGRIADLAISQIRDLLPWNLAPSLKVRSYQSAKTNSSSSSAHGRNKKQVDTSWLHLLPSTWIGGTLTDNDVALVGQRIIRQKAKRRAGYKAGWRANRRGNKRCSFTCSPVTPKINHRMIAA